MLVSERPVARGLPTSKKRSALSLRKGPSVPADLEGTCAQRGGATIQ